MYSSTNANTATTATTTTFNGIPTTNKLPNSETQTPVNPVPTENDIETVMNHDTVNTEPATTNTNNIVILEGIEFDLSTAKRKNGRYTEDFKAKVVQLKTDKNASYSVIKDSLNISQKSVSEWVKDANPTPIKAPQTPSELLQTTIDEKQAKVEEIDNRISDKVRDLLQEKEILIAEIESYRIALDALSTTDSETVV